MLNKIVNYCKELFINDLIELRKNIFKTKNLRFLALFIISYWLLRDFAFAADGKTGGDNQGEKSFQALIDFLNGFLFVIVMISKVLVMLVGWLLSPDWTFGDIIGLRPVLHKIWIFISNVVYFIFAIMLIVIALLNIFHESKSFAIKSALPKLVLGIIMVPFTWFIVSATLSVANVMTASVLSIPFDTIKTSDNKQISGALESITIPKKIVLDLSEKNTDKIVQDSEEQITLAELLRTEQGAYNLLPVYAYGVFKIQDYKKIDLGNVDTINNIINLFKKLFTGALFGIIFCILVIAIIFALFTRMAMLWLYAMFSPLFALNIFMGGSKIKAMEKLGKMSILKFVSLAMVPVYVSAALSFGLMFLSITQNNLDKTTDTSDSIFTKCSEDGNCQEMKKFGLTLQVKGSLSAKGASGLKDATNLTTGFISQFIISVLALIILWMAVMAALGANEITEKAVKPIAEFGDSIGKLMVDAPKYIPIKLPGSGKSVTLAGVGAMGQSISSAITSAATKSGMEIGQQFGNKITGTADKSVNKLSLLGNEARNHISSKPEQSKYVMKNLDEAGLNAEGWGRNVNARKEFVNNLKNVGITDEALLKEIGEASNSKTFAAALSKLDKKLDGGLFVAGSAQSDEDIIKYLNNKEDKGASGKVEGNSNQPKSVITNPSLYPNSVKKDGGNVTINVTGQADGSTATRPITLDVSKLPKNQQGKVSDINEVIRLLKEEGLSGDDAIKKIATSIIQELNK